MSPWIWFPKPQLDLCCYNNGLSHLFEHLGPTPHQTVFLELRGASLLCLKPQDGERQFTGEYRRKTIHNTSMFSSFSTSTVTTCRTEANSLAEINECVDKEELSRVSIEARSQSPCLLSLAELSLND